MTIEATYIPWFIGTAVVLALLWLAWRRPNRRRLPWRIFASIVAGISMVLMVFPPSFQKQIDPGSAVLLTQGYEPDTLAALLQKLKPAPAVYSYQTENRQAASITNLYTLLQKQPQLQTVHLLGNGLEAQELEALEKVKVISHLTAPPNGISSINWPVTTQLGDAIEISGQHRNTAGEDIRLYLLAAGKVQDSVHLKEEGTHGFKLGFTPKQEGRFVYSLLAKGEEGTDTLGQVPVQVLPTEELSVLLLSATPLFEFKFLKNHLGNLQHRVAFRSTVSKGLTQTEWINMRQTSLNRLSPKLLELFDLVITEPQALQDLSQAEKIAMQKAVSKDGLGVLTIKGEQQPNRSTAFFTNFPLKRVSQQDSREVNVQWADNRQASATALPYLLTEDDKLLPLVLENDERALVASQKKGWGSVAMSLIPQTFSWHLEGKEETYASYWAHILTEVAKKKEQERFWQLVSPQAPKKGRPVNLTYTDYAANKAPEALVKSSTDSTGVKLTLLQDQYLPEKFEAVFWPQSTGWHTVITEGAPTFHFFVQDSADWQYEAVQQRRNETKAFLAKYHVNIDSIKPATTQEQVSVYWFFLLFVLSSGFLWFEEKL